MNSEFDQIQEKIAEYEILRQDVANKPSISEQAEQVKNNLKNQLIIEFLRVNEAILRLPDDVQGEKWNKENELRQIYDNTISGESGNFLLLSMALRDCIDLWDFFWPEKGSFVDQLTPDSISQFAKIMKRRQKNSDFHSSLNFLFIPPISRDEIPYMLETIEQKFGFKYRIADTEFLNIFEPVKRPDFTYPLCFSYDNKRMLEDQKLDEFVKSKMTKNYMNGLTLPEYLLQATHLSQRVDGSWKCINRVLLDERDSRTTGLNYLRVTEIDENSAIIGSKADEPKINEVMLCLNGWGE